jgi:hypothetical protein
MDLLFFDYTRKLPRIFGIELTSSHGVYLYCDC